MFVNSILFAVIIQTAVKFTALMRPNATLKKLSTVGTRFNVLEGTRIFWSLNPNVVIPNLTFLPFFSSGRKILSDKSHQTGLKYLNEYTLKGIENGFLLSTFEFLCFLEFLYRRVYFLSIFHKNSFICSIIRKLYA